MQKTEIPSELAPREDNEAVKHLKQAIASGKHWFIALLEAMGLWTQTEETVNGRYYRYLIDGEAFDWLLLAERLCQTVNGLLPEEEKTALLFHGEPPIHLTPEEYKSLIGASKYHQYLNFFYGVTVEESLIAAVQEEIVKEKRASGLRHNGDYSNEAYRRIYGATRTVLLHHFREAKGYAQADTIGLSELKEFTYWLFKYRLEQCDGEKVASDTKKGLAYLKRQSRLECSEGLNGLPPANTRRHWQ
ncbi:MAG: hypothetical protein HY670_10920 [Chloroflexi bacterium]|nr:hypothetical protein [Chloroflexota bacterium]